MDGMVDISDTRQGKLMARVAALSERVMQMAAERAEGAETAADFKIYADAAMKAARNVRMTLSLEHRIVWGTLKERRENRAEIELAGKEAVARRRQQVYAALEVEVLQEYEDEDFRAEILADIQDTLREEARLATFLDERPDHQIARLKRLFDLDGQGPDFEDDDEEPTSPDAAASAMVEGAGLTQGLKPVRWGGPPDDPFILGEVTVHGGPLGGPRPDSS